MVHFSFEKWLKGEGIKPTIFQSGKRKTDGHPFADLPADVADRFQAQIDTLGGVFEDRVAKWRGMTSRAVKATEADRFLAKDAVDIGFADGIASPVEVFAALAATVGQSIGNPAPGAFSLR
jgi:ClpP class serine protease